MSNPYQVLGTSIPPMLGRKGLLAQIQRHLQKASPAHISIVGPRSYGKSVLLTGAAKTAAASGRFTAVTYVDFRHSPPATDADFRQRFAEGIKAALAPVDSELASYIDLNDANLHEILAFVVQEVQRKPGRLLAVLDGFDHVRPGSGLTRNLLDQLRALTQHGSLLLATGSRRTLRELCENEASRVSDFHEIFEQPIIIGPFDNSDWDDLLAPLGTRRVTLDGSARKEIANWSGGIPLLAIALLKELWADAAEGATCSKDEVDAVAESLVQGHGHLLSAIWDDCDVVLRGDTAALAAKPTDGVLLSDLSDGRLRALEGHGFGIRSGHRVRSSCRLMAKHALLQAPAAADLKRLFGTREGYDANVRSLLEHRLAQVLQGSVSPRLRLSVQAAVRDLEPDPEFSLRAVRHIVEETLNQLWAAELAPDRKLPDAWVAEWRRAGANVQWLDAGNKLPANPGLQCRALRLCTGSEGIRPTARFATKPTALLLDALHSIGNFGQHRGDFPESTVTKGFAAAVVMSAIELVEGVARDLART